MVTELVLLLLSVSVVAVVAAATFVSEPDVGATNVTVYLTVSAGVKVVTVGQATMPAVLVPAFEALTKVPVTGNVSVITTLAASLGPRLVTWTV